MKVDYIKIAGVNGLKLTSYDKRCLGPESHLTDKAKENYYNDTAEVCAYLKSKGY